MKLKKIIITTIIACLCCGGAVVVFAKIGFHDDNVENSILNVQETESGMDESTTYMVEDTKNSKENLVEEEVEMNNAPEEGSNNYDDDSTMMFDLESDID